MVTQAYPWEYFKRTGIPQTYHPAQINEAETPPQENNNLAYVTLAVIAFFGMVVALAYFRSKR